LDPDLRERIDIDALRSKILVADVNVTQDHLTEECLHQVTLAQPNSSTAWYRYSDWCYRQGYKSLKRVHAGYKHLLTEEESRKQRELLALVFQPQQQQPQQQTPRRLPQSKQQQQQQSKQMNDLIQMIDEKIWRFVALDMHKESVMSRAIDSQERAQTAGKHFEEIILEYFSKPEIVKLSHSRASYSEESALTTSESGDKKDEKAFTMNAEIVFSFVRLWTEVRSRVLQPFQSAVEGYLKFLSLFDIGEMVDSRKQAKDDLHCSKATLRILRILISYGTDFPQLISCGLSVTPTSFWSYIIPQLFSHIGHPSPWVCDQVTSLIKRIGRDHPVLIVYPAVVNSTTTAAIESTLANALMESRYADIMNDLQGHSPSLVKEVKLMINEFSRMATTWEDHCATTLRQIQHDVVHNRLKRIKEEMKRVERTAGLTPEEKEAKAEEAYKTIMAPMMVRLGRLLKDLEESSSTPYEVRIREVYGDLLRAAYNSFCNPPHYKT